MALTKISELEVGKKLAQDIFTPYGQLLLKKGTILTWRHLKSLYQQGIREVMLHSEGPIYQGENDEDPSPPPPKAENRPLSDLLQQSTAAFKQTFDQVARHLPLEIEPLEEIVSSLSHELAESHNLIRHIRNFKNREDYTYEHSVSVAAISMQIGYLLNYSRAKLSELGKAGLLHDIGKALIAPEILRKNGPLSDAEFAEISRHPVIGFNLTAKIYGGSSAICQGILQHHERMDGSGYPSRLRGSEIHEFGRILAIADVFDAVTSNRAYSRKISLYQAAEELSRGAFGKLDPFICQQFLSYLTNFFVGNVIRLNTGEIGEVIRIDPSEPTRPLVRIGEKYIDLRTSRDRLIEEILS